jgi:hypothetical protein
MSPAFSYLLSFAMLIFISMAAFAAENKPSAQLLAFLTNQKAGTVTFEMDGRRMDRLGLWANGVGVTGDVSYSGVLADTRGAGQ